MPTRAGVTVNTWGTQNYASGWIISNGLPQVTGSVVCGRNVGHASLLLAMPDTPENRSLVDDHLGETDIPVEYKVYQTKLIKFQKGMAPQLTDENVYEERLIEIYFSWWPGQENEDYSFNTFHKDTELERQGLDFHYDPRWEDFLNPSLQEGSGKIGKWLTPTITLGPGLMTHEKACSPLEIEVLRTYQQACKIREKIKSSMLLFNKLNERNEQNESLFTILPEEILIAKNLFPKMAWDKMSDQQFLPRLKKSIRGLYSKNIVNIYRYAKALDRLDGRHALNTLEAEIKIYQDRVQNLGLLLNKFKEINIVLASKEEIEVLNELLKQDPDLKECFQTVNGRNFHAIKEVIEFELNAAEEDSLIFKFQKLHERKELLINFYQCIDNIQRTQSLLKKISKCERRDLEFILNTANVDEAIIELKSLIKPGKGKFFKEFGQIVNSATVDIISFLEENNALDLFEKTTTQGKQPDHTVTLPLKRDGKDGLDAKKMLIKMAEIARQGSKFNLVNNNCAVAANEVLASGADKNSGIFEERTLRAIATPQMVYRNAIKYSDLMDTPRHKKPLRFSSSEQSTKKQVPNKKPMPYKARLW